jgi:hypothetical protein
MDFIETKTDLVLYLCQTVLNKVRIIIAMNVREIDFTEI